MSKFWSFWTPGVQKMTNFGFWGSFLTPLFCTVFDDFANLTGFCTTGQFNFGPPKIGQNEGVKKGRFSCHFGGTPKMTKMSHFEKSKSPTRHFWTKNFGRFLVIFGPKPSGSYLRVLVKKRPKKRKKRVFNDAGSLALFVTFFRFSHFWPF